MSAHQGLKAEKEFERLYYAALTNSMDHQNQDIDAFFPNGESVSIKHQKHFHICNAFNFELQLENPDTNQRIPGNFRYNNAKYTAHRAGDEAWWVFLTSDLKRWFECEGQSCEIKTTTRSTEEGNRNWGKGKFRRSYCAIVPLDAIRDLAVLQSDLTHKDQSGMYQHNWNLFNKALFVTKKQNESKLSTPEQARAAIERIRLMLG